MVTGRPMLNMRRRTTSVISAARMTNLVTRVAGMACSLRLSLACSPRRRDGDTGGAPWHALILSTLVSAHIDRMIDLVAQYQSGTPYVGCVRRALVTG